MFDERRKQIQDREEIPDKAESGDHDQNVYKLYNITKEVLLNEDSRFRRNG